MKLRTFKPLTICVLVIFIFSSVVWGAPSPPCFQLTILHSNDFHGEDYAALARMATLIKKIRTEEPNVLYLNAGDLFTRGPYHKKFYGELEFAALNAIGCDALTLGNNEFKATDDAPTATEYLYDRLKQAQFPILCANVTVTKTGEYLPKVQPYIIKNIGGMRIGLIGVTTSIIGTYRQAKAFTVTDPLDVAQKLYPEVASHSDLVLALTHIGINEDCRLSVVLPKLAAIIGGHSHTVLDQPYLQTNIPIVQAGSLGHYLGRLDLTFEEQENHWVLKKFNGKLIPIQRSIPEDLEVKAIVDEFMERLRKKAAS